MKKDFKELWKIYLEKNKLRNLLYLSLNGQEVLKEFKLTHLAPYENDFLLITLSLREEESVFLLDKKGKFIRIKGSPFKDTFNLSEEDAKWLNTLFVSFKPELQKIWENTLT